MLHAVDGRGYGLSQDIEVVDVIISKSFELLSVIVSDSALLELSYLLYVVGFNQSVK